MIDGAVPVVVVSDFGRDAALRFCNELSRREREQLSTELPAGASFYDEYRRITLHVVGDLPFVKAPWLSAYDEDGRPLDDGVLVGFPGGPPLEAIVSPIAALVVEALAGPAARGCERAVVALPCNTLAPVSWGLQEGFVSRTALAALIEDAGYEPPGLHAVEPILGQVSFPTVPEAVLWQCGREGAEKALPLGTAGIVESYERAAGGRGDGVTVVRPAEAWQQRVLEAIQASIAGDAARREASERALRGIRDEAIHRWGPATAVIEACTDLDYGVGMDSGRAYARYVVDRVYGHDVDG